MFKLKKINAFSLARIYALIMGAMGLVIGIFYAALFFLGGEEASALGINNLYILGGIILFPILYGVLGFIAGGATAYLYNYLSKLVGGIEFEIDKK